MLIFREKGVDVTVLEVGLGGRLDATNVIEKPAVCVIASISLDHTEILGDTIAAIAGEKAGIIKEGCPVVYDDSVPEASAVIRKTAAGLKAEAVPVSPGILRSCPGIRAESASGSGRNLSGARNSGCPLWPIIRP